MRSAHRNLPKYSLSTNGPCVLSRIIHLKFFVARIYSECDCSSRIK